MYFRAMCLNKVLGECIYWNTSVKMMSMMRKRAEAARRKRIDHVFIKADDNSNGKITPQQMIKLFAANGEVCYSFMTCSQVFRSVNDLICKQH